MVSLVTNKEHHDASREGAREVSERQGKDWPGCPMCARLQRYADTAWNRGHTMGMKANEDVARQAMDALRVEKAAHADTNAMLTASLLEAEKTCDELAEALRELYTSYVAGTEGEVGSAKRKAKALLARIDAEEP